MNKLTISFIQEAKNVLVKNRHKQGFDASQEQGTFNNGYIKALNDFIDILHSGDVKSFKCVLCKKLCYGFGNNPSPLAKKGRCCNSCDFKVVSARLEIIKKQNNA